MITKFHPYKNIFCTNKTNLENVICNTKIIKIVSYNIARISPISRDIEMKGRFNNLPFFNFQ